MRVPVKCKNCGLKWLRVTVFGEVSEFTDDLQYRCPHCGSNWYEEIDAKNATSNFTDTLVDVASEPAEISFKAGIKEVVDFVNSHLHDSPSCSYTYCFSKRAWQAKLKEWGYKP